LRRPELADEVAHFFVLDLEVALEGWFAGNGGGDALGDSDASVFESGYFFGVVGHQADGGDAEMFEDFGGELELAVVGAVAEGEVGFDRVEALVLELVGAELGHEADAAAFLLLVEKDAGALVDDAGEREVELVVAVAAQGVEDVAGEALRVDADDWRRGMDVPEDESHGGLDTLLRGHVVGGGGLGVIQDAFETEDSEMSPARGEVGVSHFADAIEGHINIIDSQGRGLDSLAGPGWQDDNQMTSPQQPGDHGGRVE
jgi:hypothetical protein